MYANPFTRNLKSIFVYAGVWLFTAAFYFSLIYWGVNEPLHIAVPDSIIFNLILSGLGLSFWYPAKFIRYEKEKTFRFLVTHLAGSIISIVLWLSTGYIITDAITAEQQVFREFFFSTLAWRILIGVLIYFLVVSFYYVIIYYTEYQEKKTRENELKNLVTEAELRSLKFQINPHFIFNSLNSISSLTLSSPADAQSMLLKLADFLRYTISNNSRHVSRFDEELKNIKLYLDIEKIRFDQKLEYYERIQEQCLHVPVPNMLLQPLIENAIKHSVYEALEKVTIRISSEIKDGFLNIEISNTLEKESVVKGTGTGLKNISERLFLLYNRHDLIKVEKNKGMFKVNLFIPVQEPPV